MSQVMHEDLVAWGMCEELMNRFTSICVLRPLSAQNLKQILMETTTSPLRSLQRTAEAIGFRLRWTPALVDAVVAESLTMGQAARGLSTIAQRVCRRVMFEVPDRLRGTRTQTAVVTLGVEAIREGSYRLDWRAGRRAQSTPQRLVADDEAAGEGDGVGSSAG
jgi:ATP-dependent protease Clp ATPase subunit